MDGCARQLEWRKVYLSANGGCNDLHDIVAEWHNVKSGLSFGIRIAHESHTPIFVTIHAYTPEPRLDLEA